jgi:alkylhydroperoxidase family enzyme
MVMIRITVPDARDSSEFAHSLVPEISAAAVVYSRAVYRSSCLSIREAEGARLRTAQINGCLLCQNFRMARDVPGYVGPTDRLDRAHGDVLPDEAFYIAVEKWRTSSLFSPRERLAIEFAEGMGQEPISLADNEAFWERMHARFSDTEITDLSFSVASWIALGRVTHVLGLDSSCEISTHRLASTG